MFHNEIFRRHQWNAGRGVATGEFVYLFLYIHGATIVH